MDYEAGYIVGMYDPQTGYKTTKRMVPKGGYRIHEKCNQRAGHPGSDIKRHLIPQAEHLWAI